MRILSSIRILLVLTLLLFVSNLVNADSPNYDIAQVEVNDLLAFSSSGNVTLQNLNIELLENIQVEITLKASDNITGGFVDQVRCEASLEGYEFGLVRDITPVFTVEEGNTYKKMLNVQVPEDIEASEPYTLRTECSDTINEESIDFTLFINEIRHFIRIFDMLLNPGSTIQAGKPLFVTVRLENLGQKQEDQIKVRVSIPELGVQSVGFIDELVTKIQEETEQFLFEEESSGDIDLQLRVPEDAKSGDYTLRVDVEYNRGHTTVSDTLPLSVVGVEKPKEVEAVLNIDSTTKQVAQGEEVTYRLMIANLGSERGIFSVQLDGTSSCCTSSVEPGFLTVMPESTGEVLIRVKPNEDAEPRRYVFTASIMLGNQLVNQINLNLEVKEKAKSAAPALAFKNVLAVVFGLLVVVLVILGIIIAFKKGREEEEGKSETPAVEAQTYYYRPK